MILKTNSKYAVKKEEEKVTISKQMMMLHPIRIRNKDQELVIDLKEFKVDDANIRTFYI